MTKKTPAEIADQKFLDEIDDLEAQVANLKAGLNKDGSSKTTGSSD